MELFLALAAVIVAGATLFFAVVAQRRFDVHETRIGEAEQNVTRLRDRQQAIADNAQAASQADALRFGELSESVEKATAELGARLGDLEEQTTRQAATLKELSDEAASSDEARAKLTGIDARLLALGAQLGQLDRDRREVHAQLRTWLARSSQQASATPAARVMPGFIQVERQAAAQILPHLYELLLRAADLDFVFREQSGPASVYYYLVPSSPDSQPEQQLAGLLGACRNPGTILPGLAELRALLRAMHAGGPGSVRVGPLVADHAADGRFSGALLTEAEAGNVDAAGLASSPGRCVSLLRELPADRVVDLAAWAAAGS